MVYNVKKVNDFPVPSRDVTIVKRCMAEKNKIIPGQVRQILVSDIPAGDRKIVNLLYSVPT
jgi:hypothetical protein